MRRKLFRPQPPSRFRRLRKNKPLMAVLLACATAVILLVGADLVARTVIENRISSAFAKSLGYDVEVRPGGVAEVRLRPKIDAGRLTFALDGVNIFGRPAPDQYRQTIEDRLPNGSRQKANPLGMSMKSVRVTDSGVRVTLRGNPTELKRS